MASNIESSTNKFNLRFIYDWGSRPVPVLKGETEFEIRVLVDR